MTPACSSSETRTNGHGACDGESICPVTPDQPGSDTSVFTRHASSLRPSAPQMRSYRPTYFSPVNRRWVSAPSRAHFHRALTLEFGGTLAYDLTSYRLQVPLNRGMATGAIDCWIRTASGEWVETFTNDHESSLGKSTDKQALAARRWCVAHRIAHRLVSRHTLSDRTILRENQRRVITHFDDAFVSRTGEVEAWVERLLGHLAKNGPQTMAETLAATRDVTPEGLAKMALCELIRTGRVEIDLTKRVFDGSSQLAPKERL